MQRSGPNVERAGADRGAVPPRLLVPAGSADQTIDPPPAIVELELAPAAQLGVRAELALADAPVRVLEHHSVGRGSFLIGKHGRTALVPAREREKRRDC